MGYSARYHVASLVAVFIALAVGILIGAALGSDVVSGTADNLEQDLREDVDEFQARVAELEQQLDRERAFGDEIYPAVVASRLQGDQIALIGLGAVGSDVSADVEAALAPSGAELAEVAAVREPPDTGDLIGTLPAGKGNGQSRAEALETAARRAGRLLIAGGNRLENIRTALLEHSSGDPDRIDGAIVVRDRPELDERAAAETDALERSLIEGMLQAGVPVVAAERSDTEESAIDFFADQLPATVDNVDQTAGKLALVLTLDGAEGNFGISESADRLLPELVGPVRELQTERGESAAAGSRG